MNAWPSHWYVAFCDSPNPAWWQRFMKPGFRHVEMFAWDERSGHWLIVSPNFDLCLVMTKDDAEFARYRVLLNDRGARVLLCRSEASGPYVPRLFVTCVSIVSAVLGLPFPGAVRPFALYRMLLKRGATEV